MAKITAWALLGLGIIHLFFGMARFKGPLMDALQAGFVGQFAQPEIRRTAFWFLMAGPLMMVLGHITILAEAAGNLEMLRVIGLYLFVASLIGVFAFPVSPLWGPLILSLPLIAVGFGWAHR